MWELAGYLCAAVLLAYHSVFDGKEKRIPVRSLALGVVLSCVWSLARTLLGAQSWAVLCVGLLPGITALVLAKVTGGQVGWGDGWELILMGNWMGAKGCALALGIALSGIFLISAVLLLLGKVTGRTRIPFVPFLWVGTVVALLQFYIQE